MSDMTIVNTSAYGFCVFQEDELPKLRDRIVQLGKELHDTNNSNSSNKDTEQQINEKDKYKNEVNTKNLLQGTILLTPEGLNIRLSGTIDSVTAMEEMLRSLHPDLSTMEFKHSYSSTLTLRKFLVRIKQEVIALGKTNIQPAKHGLATHISPTEFKHWMDEKHDMLILDTRNDYEYRLGTFTQAKTLDIKSFKAFPQVAKEELKQVPKDKDIVMFCTGGVRCEKASYALQEEGYKNVYQLDGGILKYFEQVGGEHYNGECYIFDDRVSLTSELKEGSAITCFKCRNPVTKEEQESSDYKKGEYCPYCRYGKCDFRSFS